jgi:DHA3 family macrolide efflux protein-like MFS transporter
MWILKEELYDAISNIALGPTNVLAPMLIRKVIHANAAALGVFDASIGLGILVAGLLLGFISAKKVGILFACGIGLQGLAMAIVATAQSLLVAYVEFYNGPKGGDRWNFF